MEILAQPDQRIFYWNFDTNSRWINSKQFQIFYVEINILPVLLVSFLITISVCWGEMITQSDRTQKPGILRFWQISAVECTSPTSVSQFHMKRMFTLSEWSQQTHSRYLKQHQYCHGTVGKNARPMKKRCVTRTFCSQPASWDIRYQNETSELVVQTLLFNSNYWKQLISTFMRLFLGGHNEKWTV